MNDEQEDCYLRDVISGLDALWSTMPPGHPRRKDALRAVIGATQLLRDLFEFKSHTLATPRFVAITAHSPGEERLLALDERGHTFAWAGSDGWVRLQGDHVRNPKTHE